MDFLPKITEVKTLTNAVSSSFIDNMYVFHYVHSGNLQFKIAGNIYNVKADTALLLPPHVLHNVNSYHNEFHMSIFHFQSPVNTELQKLPLAVSIAGNAKSMMVMSLKSLNREWENKSLGYAFTTRGLVSVIIGIYLRQSNFAVSVNEKIGSHWKSIEKAIWYMQTNYHDSKLTIKQVSEHVNISYAYFCQIFKSYMGVSPYRYLSNYRINKAKRFILRKEKNISETAVAVGFENNSSFSKAFNRETLLSPRAWLKKSR